MQVGKRKSKEGSVTKPSSRQRACVDDLVSEMLSALQQSKFSTNADRRCPMPFDDAEPPQKVVFPCSAVVLMHYVVKSGRSAAARSALKGKTACPSSVVAPYANPVLAQLT